MAKDTYLSEQLGAFDEIQWSVACRKMQVLLLRGHANLAHRVLDEFCGNSARVKATMNSPLSTVLPIRIVNALESAGYATVQAVAGATDGELLSLPQVGPRMLSELRAVLEKIKNGEHWEHWEDAADLIDDRVLEMSAAASDRHVVKRRRTTSTAKLSREKSTCA